ncbi:MAG: fumarate hydratase [Treponema sp.]|jgi:fumarate hydratase subunit alpha|nr:fumarate hydratase [Treponema sp.]
MRILEAERITEAVSRLCITANRELPEDVRERLRKCRDEETWPAARDILDKIIENFELAAELQSPVCQDTGMACVFLEIGEDVHIAGDLYAAVNEGVRRGCRDGYLRASMVRDPLDRVNTGDNTPAMVYADFVKGSRVTVTVAPKGFGSENMSRIAMLRPSDGAEGVIDFVIRTVEEAGPNPCPPIVVGVGIGGSFDKAAFLARKALLRPLGTSSPLAFYAELENTLLEKINALGIGPQGFGGKTTALAVMVETLPTHIAGLPCAVNISCHVARHAGEVL